MPPRRRPPAAARHPAPPARDCVRAARGGDHECARRSAARARSPYARGSRYAPRPARLRQQLERRLAVAVLQVLLAQPMAVHAQQQLAPGLRHERHLLHLIGSLARHCSRRADDRPALVFPAPHRVDTHPCPSRVKSSLEASLVLSRVILQPMSIDPALETPHPMSLTDRLHALDRPQQRQPAAQLPRRGDQEVRRRRRRPARGADRLLRLRLAVPAAARARDRARLRARRRSQGPGQRPALGRSASSRSSAISCRATSTRSKAAPARWRSASSACCSAAWASSAPRRTPSSRSGTSRASAARTSSPGGCAASACSPSSACC